MRFVLWIVVNSLLALPASAWQSPSPDCTDTLVPAGIEVPVVLAQAIDPRTAKTGDSIIFVLVDDFPVGGCIVVEKGVTSLATISALTRPRSFGRAGTVELQFESIGSVDGQRLWFGPGHHADDGQLNSARGIALPSTPVRLTLHGSHATVPRGTLVSLTVARSIEIRGRPVVDPPSADPIAPATVIIFQSPAELTPGQDHLYSGGVFLSCFERARYFKDDLPVGNYRLGKSKVQLQLNPGTKRYFRIYNEEAGAIEEASAGEFEFFAPELKPLKPKCNQSILRHAFRPIKPKR